MKRRLVVLMAALMMMVTSAIAESASMDLLAQMDGQVFEFSSGVGAWSTELTRRKLSGRYAVRMLVSRAIL